MQHLFTTNKQQAVVQQMSVVLNRHANLLKSQYFKTQSVLRYAKFVGCLKLSSRFVS